MKAKPSKKVAGIIIRSRKSIVKDGVVTVSRLFFALVSFSNFVSRT